jgi:protein-disulfide isomerase
MENNTQEEIKKLEAQIKELKEKESGAASTSNSNNPYSIPVAVLIAGLLIAGAVFYSGGNPSDIQPTARVGDVPSANQPTPVPGSGSIENIKPVTSKDHIKGNPNAPIKIIEFSDFECPFCKKFHPTMQRVIDEYGKDGKVAWIYRHFPLDSIHPKKARNEAVASECAAELGGNSKFWEYADKIFEITPSNNRLDQALLPNIAEDIGLNRAKFEACLTSGKFDTHVESDLQDGIASGGTGTPYSILIDVNGQKYPISGAQPYASVKSIIDIALKNK